MKDVEGCESSAVNVRIWMVPQQRHFPDMKSDAESEVNQNDEYRPLELVDKNVDKTGLEDVRVEEQQEQDDDRKQNTDILNHMKHQENNILRTTQICERIEAKVF